MKVREADLADLAGIATLDTQVFEGDAYPALFFRQALDAWPDLLLVCEEAAGELSGYALMAPATRAGEFWLLSMAVHPRHRGRGRARRLLEHLLLHLEAHGAQRVKLTVHPDNPARVLYSSLGFVIEGFDPQHFGPAAPRVWMGLTLPGNASN